MTLGGLKNPFRVKTFPCVKKMCQMCQRILVKNPSRASPEHNFLRRKMFWPKNALMSSACFLVWVLLVEKSFDTKSYLQSMMFDMQKETLTCAVIFQSNKKLKYFLQEVREHLSGMKAETVDRLVQISNKKTEVWAKQFTTKASLCVQKFQFAIVAKNKHK